MASYLTAVSWSLNENNSNAVCNAETEYCYQELAVLSSHYISNVNFNSLSNVCDKAFLVLILVDSYCLGSEEQGCGSTDRYSTGKGLKIMRQRKKNKS